MRGIIQSALRGLAGVVLTLIFPAFAYATIPDCVAGCDFEGELLCNLIDLLACSIDLLLGIGAAVALLFVMIGGLQYMASGGDEKSLASAKKTVTYSVAGLVVILGAILAIKVLLDIFGVQEGP